MDFKFYSNPAGEQPRRPHREGIFKDFDATELFCQKCKQAVPVRKRLLIVLPDGDKYEYLCAYCASSVGTKIERNEKPLTIIV